MCSSDGINVKNIDLILNHQKIIKTIPTFDPSPYTFTKVENGRKVIADSTSFTPPSWLLLDHTIAVIWIIFSLNSPVQQLSINDLKWAYEFLKEVKNKKGENPPDVKVCLKEIQDRLIDLYAKLRALKEEDFHEIAVVFSDKVTENVNPDYINPPAIENRRDIKFDTFSPSRKSLLEGYHSCKDIPGLKNATNCSKNGNTSLESDSTFYDDASDEEVEKYVLSLLEDEEKKESLQLKKSVKSLIPTKKKPVGPIPEITQDKDATNDDVIKKEKTSKRVHCVAEMRSLKFQKSTKVTDTNGEEAAYSNLKAEIQRLTINPDISKNEVMKFLKDWRSEQVKKLLSEPKSLGNIKDPIRKLKVVLFVHPSTDNEKFVFLTLLVPRSAIALLLIFDFIFIYEKVPVRPLTVYWSLITEPELIKFIISGAKPELYKLILKDLKS